MAIVLVSLIVFVGGFIKKKKRYVVDNGENCKNNLGPYTNTYFCYRANFNYYFIFKS